MLVSHFSPTETAGRPREVRSLPAHHQTSFVGRAKELRRLRALADPRRLVSIVGPAGAGKSRLALELSRTSVHALEVSLRGTRDAEALLGAVAAALGLRRIDGEARAAALGRAATRQGVSLLICDACEGLDRRAIQTLTAIRSAAPRLAVVVTSQRALGVDAEHVLRLGSMSDDEARALFVERVLHARGGAGLDHGEAAQVGALLACLSNLPLTLELAASRLAVLDVEALLTRLGDGLDVLDHGAALAETVDWAISLLEPQHRAALGQATRFAGGFDLDAAESVIDLGSGRVIDWLQEMVHRSLISVRRSGRTTRYELYEAVEHRAARLLDDRQRADVDARFTAYFAHAAARLGAHPSASLRRTRQWMRAEQRNLRAAEARANDPVVVVEIALACEVGRFGGEASEVHLARLERVVECARTLGSSTLLARALIEQGRFLRLRGRGRRARPHLDEALTVARRTGVDTVVALAQVERGRLLCDLGEYEGATEDLTAGLALAPSHPRVLADAHVSLGVVAYHRDDLGAAERAFERARVHYESVDDRAGQAVALSNLASVARSRNQLERARRGFLAACPLHQAEGNLRGEGIALSNLGNVERCIGRYADARAHLNEALHLLRLAGNRRSHALARCFLGLVELAEGRLDAAESELEGARVEAEDVLPPRDLALIVDGLVEVAEARGEAERACELRAEAAELRVHTAPLRVAADGRWFCAGGERVSLSRRRSARLVLAALVDLRERAASASLSRAALVEAGWPGEKILERAARQRLYVLINSLRKLGLDALETTDEGYRLDPCVPLRVSP